MILTKDLSGDGRKKVSPNPDMTYLRYGRPSLSTTLSRARMVIENITHFGWTTHSPMGGLIWIIQEWAALNNIMIKVRGDNKLGFEVRIKE